MQTPDCQDWTTVTIHNKNHFSSNNKGKQNKPGNKEFQALNDDDIPKLEKITPMQSAALRVCSKCQKNITISFGSNVECKCKDYSRI